MIKITNGKAIYTVTKGAFDSIYEPQGFKPVKAAKVEKPAQPKANETEKKGQILGDEEFVATMYETPVSEWTKSETLRFAELNGVDISEAKNIEAAKEMLRKELEF